MTNSKLGRWLLVALAVVGLALAAPVVSAHGDETTADDAHHHDGTADDWATWMEERMTEHVGPGALEWMESYMGVSVDGMARDVAAHGPDDRTGGHGHC